MKIDRSDLELEILSRRMHAEEIDLQPEYQRGEVWPLQRRQKLIDTVLRGWYVPAIHLLRKDETMKETVLDGQQRLVAIRDFFAGELPIDGNVEPHDPEIVKLHGKFFSELPGDLQRKFQRYLLPVVVLSQYRPEEPYELFFRLNHSMSLTPPEKRNALFGKARNQVRELVFQLESDQLLDASTVGFSNRRMAYDDVFARVCLALQLNTLKTHLSNGRIEDFYRSSEFNDDVLNLAMTSATTLFRACQEVEKARFNKASLFSWLVVGSSAPLNDVPNLPALVAFIQVAKGEHRREFVTRYFDDLGIGGNALEALAEWLLPMYDNRASFRVTDVSSVLIRDFILHAAIALATPKPRRKNEAIYQIIDYVDMTRGEGSLLEAIDAHEWGDLIHASR